MVQSPVRAESVDPERPQVDRTRVPGNKMRDELTTDGSSRQPQMVMSEREEYVRDGTRPRTWCTSRESWFGSTRAQLTTADKRAV